ncbi:MAG: hypothetical protein F4Y04_00805 [Chloroflexi bacterium]|nr:hypothetical protein [Chloroflexota bacterium]
MTTSPPALVAPAEERPFRAWIDSLLDCNPSDTYVIARMSIWGRWILWVVALVYFLSRPDFSVAENPTLIVLVVALAGTNAGFHWRLLSKRNITSAWFLFFSAIDAAVIMAAICTESVFQPFVYLGLFPALASVSVAFSSFLFCVVWTSMITAGYAGATLGVATGAGLETPDTATLVAQILMMFAVTFVVNMVTGYERTERLKALEREQGLHRERIELSQRIHDTAAQSAYMIGLGIDNALVLAGDDSTDLRRTLVATSDLSKSAMWELRQPIDMGLIYEGRELTEVLGAHARNFTTVTSVPAKLVQVGNEPRLEPQQRARILSIAHNALTNAHRHAHASSVTIELDFSPERILLSIVDDGIGLPEDYLARGHGFRNMQAEAERLGGMLDVQTGDRGAGTKVTCLIPYQSA